MKENNLVITGMGAVTPVGIGVAANTGTRSRKERAVWDKITRFDAGEMPVQIAAELKDFDPDRLILPKTLARTMDPFMQFAFIAAEQAIADSGLCIESESDRVGIVMGTAMDGVTTVAQTQAAFDDGQARRSALRSDDHRQHRCRADRYRARHSRSQPDAQHGLLRRR